MLRASREFTACLILLAAAIGQTSTAQTGRAAPPLFSDRAGTNVPADFQRPSTGDRARVTRVAPNGLESGHLNLNLFDDVALVARQDSREQHSDGSLVWHGRIESDPQSAVTFVRSGAIVQGSIQTGSVAYSIEPINEGPDHLIRTIDARRMPPELTPLVPPPLPDAELDRTASLEEGEILDVLVFYTAAARRQAGGSDAAVKARIALGIAETNVAYGNSGVSQRLRLVGAELVGYAESGDLGEDLQRLTDPADHFMDIVHARRDAAADLVKLVVESTAGGACGVAWVMPSVSPAFAPYAFSVTAYPCISPNYTFAHELGHNMGAAHAPEDPNAPPAFPYAYGYKDPTRHFRTVMAYDCPSGCPRVLHFSNPSAVYGGKSTGTPTQHNNALALNQTSQTVANFRVSRVLYVPVSAPERLTIDSSGTTVMLSWDRPSAGAPVGYRVEVGRDEGLADLATFTVPATELAFVQSGVPRGVYYVRVRALDEYGPGPATGDRHLAMTELGRCTDPVGTPTLREATVTDGVVALSWTAPVTGGTLDKYLVGAGTRPGAVDAAVIDTRSRGPAFSTVAAPGVYFVRVAGTNGCGVGPPSNELAVVVGPPIPGPPLTPEAGIGVDRRVTLYWQPPSAGGPASSYVVEAGSMPGACDVAILSTGDSFPTLTIVAPPGRYYVRVRAVNEYGISAPSAEIVLLVL